MIVVTEEDCRALVGRDDALAAVEDVFAAMAREDAYNFPVVREAIGHADALFGFKSGFDKARLVLGLKSGGYWPANETHGLSNHQSTIVLFNPDTGRPRALIAGNHLTALRTAAASAVSVKYLARRESRVLGIVGAGFQSAFQLRAAADQHEFDKVVGWNRHAEKLSRVAKAASEAGLPFEAVDLERLGAEADVIITITSSFAPILTRGHVRPGTHIACMGTDTRGKQELDPALLSAASVFTDEVAQAVSIGECQHAVTQNLLTQSAIAPLGAVITGMHPGRTSDEQITVFDGTGVGLQDLAIAAAAAKIAETNGRAGHVAF